MKESGLTKRQLIEKITADVNQLDKDSPVKDDNWNIAHSQDKVGITIGIVKKPIT